MGANQTDGRKQILLPRSDIPGRAPTINEIELGEIAINTHDGKAYLKRERDGEYSIETIGEERVENVYYVSKSGVPGNDGRSLMNSFATLDSAMDVVRAREGLKFNREVCERDLNVIMDGVRFDMALGTNYNAVTAGLSYLRQNAALVRDEQIIAERQSLNEERLGMISAQAVKSSETANARIGAAFDEIIDILINGLSAADSVAYSAPNIAFNSESEDSFRLLQDNKKFIMDEVVAFTNLNYMQTYDVAKCQRDTGLILDAVRRDLLIGTDYNTITAGMSYLRDTADDYLADSAARVALINSLEFARDTVTALPLITSDATINTLFDRVVDHIDGTITTYTTPTYPSSGGTYETTARLDASNNIQTNRATIIADLKTYVQGTLSLSGYDSAKCDRDTGFILDALTHDIKYGGNTGARTNALAYFDGTVNQLDSSGTNPGEVTATILAYQYLRDTLLDASVVPTAAQSEKDTLLNIIIDVLQANSTANIATEVEVDTGGLNTTEFDKIDSSSTAIINDVIDFVNDQNPTGNFDDEKCARDTGLIIDAVTLDLALNTNYNSLTAGLAYRRGNAQKVQDDQLTYTVQSINYLRDEINGLAIDSASQTYVTARIQEITQLLEDSAGYDLEDGDPIDYTGSGLEATDKRNAANSLIVNRQKIQSRTISWLSDNFPYLEYNDSKCYRDVGYLVDAIVHDILFDGNFASTTAANSYWVGTDLLAPDDNLDGEADLWTLQVGQGEKVPTVAAYEQLKTIINEYITTATEEARVVTLLDIVIGALNAADGSSIPAATLPTIVNANYDTIVAQKQDLIEETVFYANSVFPAASYDQDKCRRDIGYVVEGLMYDMRYGGQSATQIVANSYFSVFGNGYLDLVGQNEITATIGAYDHLRDIVGDIITGVAVTPTTGNTRTQDQTAPFATATDEARVDGLTTIIYTALNDKDNTSLTPIDEITEAQRPNLVNLGVVAELRNAVAAFDSDTSERQTIIRQSLANADNFGTDTTIRLMSGDYLINNPIQMPPKTAIVGDNLRTSTVRPKNPDSDMFWVNNGCFIKDITFRDHQNGAACVAYNPNVDSPGAGPFITQSPYVQNCTSLTTSGVGMKIDGSKVSGLRSMVLDAFTQFNADGIGVLMQNRAYAQLVSCFTISTSTSIKAETGAQCSITNSNSSFGDFGLVATGGSQSLYDGTLHADYQINDNIIRVNGIINRDSANYSLNIGDFKTPNYNDAIKFANDSYYYTVLNVSDEITQDWATSGNTDEVAVTQQTVGQSSGDRFGHSVDISADDAYMIVGARGRGAGTAEVFTRNNKQWDFQEQITPQAPFGGLDTDHKFGHISKLNSSGDIAAVTALFHKQTTATPSSGRYNGAVHLYTRSGSTWSDDAFFGLTAVTDRDRRLGNSMDLSDDGTTLAASTYEDLVPAGQGAVYIWQRDSVGVAWATDSSDAIRLTCPDNTSTGKPIVALGQDGTDLLASWSDRNAIYYYQQNQDGVYVLNQAIVPKINYNGISRDGFIDVNPGSTYFAFGDRNSPNGYVENSLTDANNGVPAKYARKQYLDNATFTGNTLTTTDTDADFTQEFPVGSTIRVEGITVSGTNYTVATVAPQTLTTTVGFVTTGTHTNVSISKSAAGSVELFFFDQGSWVTQDIIEAPGDQKSGYGFGYALDINTDGSIVTATNFSSSGTDSAQLSVLERAATSWSRVSTIKTQTPQDPAIAGFNAGQSDGNATAAGGSGDYIAWGLPQRQETLYNDTTRYGEVYTYSSILPETGSYELTVSPALNKALAQDQRVDFHQRSLISASSHTFEFVGSGTNMFTAVPQNGGIPKKENEIVFDSATSATPNFGQVYFTATDELGDFRIGGELTINREAGTITGTTFDRSLFAVLTPYILALSGD